MAPPRTLDRLRLRLTAWYVGTFLLVLLLLGLGLFAAITRRFDADMDSSLRYAARALATAVVTRGDAEGTRALLIPDRHLALFDSAGKSLSGAEPAWLGALGEQAAAAGATSTSYQETPERIVRVYVHPFRAADGRRLVAAAVADEVELEDKYAALIATSGAAALVALMLVAAGGWLLARQSTQPVERVIMQMRRFMADAAHELRTPVTVVRSRAEVTLRRERSTVEYREALRLVERESARIGRIVEDLLTLARADAGERPIERQPVFLDDLTLDAAEGARALAERGAVQLEVADFEEARVSADPALLRQLVLILLDNAIKFSTTGGVVRVAIRAVDRSAVLTVVDQGVGIPPEQLPHIFERFYRGDGARTRREVSTSEGAGLGLAIARWIVDEHGGSIQVESEAGQGTRVRVQFPLDNAVSSS